MLDRRRQERFALIASLPVRDADTGEALGELADISGHGLMIASPDPIALRRRYHMRLALPVDIGGELEVSAEAAWRVRSLNPVGHRTGFRELATAASHEDLLNRLIETCYAPAAR